MWEVLCGVVGGKKGVDMVCVDGEVFACLGKRQSEAQRIRGKYPDRVPVRVHIMMNGSAVLTEQGSNLSFCCAFEIYGVLFLCR